MSFCNSNPNCVGNNLNLRTSAFIHSPDQYGEINICEWQLIHFAMIYMLYISHKPIKKTEQTIANKVFEPMFWPSFYLRVLCG